MRVKHYIKNLLIFLPLFFSGNFFHSGRFFSAILGFVCFSLTSSVVYIVNDIRDADKDRNHPTKKSRPIASGKISIQQAAILMTVCLLSVAIGSYYLGNILGLIWLLLYLILNFAYSMGLKNYPIVDIVILASGFVIRVIYGGVVTGIAISQWLYLVIVSGAVFMGLGKRRNELRQQTNTRDVLKYYTESFLDKNMYMSLSLVIAFYALWTMESANPAATWTVPILMIILMKYSHDIEGASDGDPIEVILYDKLLIGLALLYIGIMFALLYI